MKAQVRLVPLGGQRVATAYLAGVLTAFGAALVGLVAWQLADQLPACRADATGSCSSLWGGLGTILGYVVLLWVVARFLLLGNWFWLAFASAILLVSQLVIQTGELGWLVLFLLVPAAAALASDSRTYDVPRFRFGDRRSLQRTILAGASVVVALEFAVWLGFVLLG